MREKLLKLARRLEKFHLDDFIMTSGEQEEEVIACIEELIREGKIKQISENIYLYLESFTLSNKIKSQKTKKAIKPYKTIEIKPREDVKIEDLFDPVEDKHDYEEYLNAPDGSKKIAEKHLRVLDASKGLHGRNKLGVFIEKWNSLYPDMKTSYAALMRARNTCERYGKAALLGKYDRSNFNKNPLEERLYSRFLQIYLSPLAPKATEAVLKVKQEVLMENPDYPNFPTLSPFLKRLRREFSEAEIKNFRTVRRKNGDGKNKEDEKPDISFKRAAELFLNSDDFKKLKATTAKSFKGYFYNYLVPFFGNYMLSQIDEDKIRKFKAEKQEESLSISSIKNYIGALRFMFKIYCPQSKLYDFLLITSEYNYLSNNIRVLEPEEIKALLSTSKELYPEIYPVIYTAISTGMLKGEILALTADCIDYENKFIKVEKTAYRGEIVKLRTKYQSRKVDIPDELSEFLEATITKNKGFIFPDSKGRVQNPDTISKKYFRPLIKKAGLKSLRFIDLRDTYAALLIRHNYPLTYIQKQLGHSSVNVTAERYKNLIPDVKIKNLKLI